MPGAKRAAQQAAGAGERRCRQQHAPLRCRAGDPRCPVPPPRSTAASSGRGWTPGRAEIAANGQDPDAMLTKTITNQPGAAVRAAWLVASALRIAAEA